LPRQIFTFDPPERFVIGTVGQPGERTFFLQAKLGEQVISVALEKIQAQVLAERLDELLDEVRRRGGDVPTVPPSEFDDVSPLDQPILEEFRVGTMALAWDGDAGVVIIEAHAQTEEPEGEPAEEQPALDVPDDAEEGPDVLRVRIDPAHARAFVKRALRVVAAGRPPCPLCELPLDPEGHVCPRQNGHRQ